MKFGQRLEEQSVPQWSIHNVDYNSLKYQIKTQTTKDQATAIAIPGHQDPSLRKFEESFYLELTRQHDRVCLFVSSKCDEIHWRLRHVSEQVNRLILQCTDNRGVTAKRQRRFAKYRQQINECGDDINALNRFIGAQRVAFAKILKKYKKWTRSTTLGSRFKDNVLSSPKSFTNRDLSALSTQYRGVLATLEATAPGSLSSQHQPRKAPSADRQPRSGRGRTTSRSSTPATTPPSPIPASKPAPAPIAYWNEYDHGSEAGDHGDDTYAIYIDPNDTGDFPGFQYLKSIMTVPSVRIRQWLGSSQKSESYLSESRSLLSHGNNGSPHDYFSIRKPGTASSTENENEAGTEDGYASSSEGQGVSPGLRRHFGGRGLRPGGDMMPTALEDAAATDEDVDLYLARYRDRVLSRTVVVFFTVSFALLIMSGALIMTARHKLRLEVDATATIGSVASLFCACMGLGALFARRFARGWLYTLAVWAAFAASCLLNGMLLVIVVRSSGI